MKIYILDHDYPNAVPEDGSEGDIDGATRFVKLEDAHAALADVLHTVRQRDARIAELEDEVAMLIHPHDLAAFRAKKSLHK